MRFLFLIYIFFFLPRRSVPQLRVINDWKQVRRNKTSFIDSNGAFKFENAVRFRLWTRANPIFAQEIIEGDLSSLESSNFDNNRLTKIFVEGRNHRVDEQKLDYTTAELRDAEIRFADINFVVVDWGMLAGGLWYYTSSGDIVTVKLARLLRFLQTNGTPLNKVHIIGFSWGAHVAGNAGRIVKGQIGRITGLDPAGPFYRFISNDYRLDKSDGKFVDIIHTSGGNLLTGSVGIPEPLGHIDFYPNGGSEQPGCPPKSLFNRPGISCHHYRSLSFYIESISSPLAFPICTPNDPCSKFILPSRLQKRQAQKTPTLFMGEHLEQATIEGDGIYIVRTRDKKPYGFGPQMDITLRSITSTPTILKNETATTRGGRDEDGIESYIMDGDIYTPNNYPNNRIIEECLSIANEKIYP